MGHDVLKLLAQTKLEPRPYQLRLIKRALTCLMPENIGGKGMRSVLIESPTGSGKTCIVLTICKAMQELYPDLAIGWISQRRNLLGQAERENREKGIMAKVDFISMFAKELPATLLAAKKRMLVCDEAQHDACDSSAHLHAMTKADYVVGMTATPYRTDRIKLCFDTILKDSSLGTLIREGWLAQYEHYTIPNWDVANVCATYINEPSRWGRTIMYFHTIKQCCEAREILSSNGVACTVVTGDSDRYQQIADLENGNVKVLINCMVLTEGMDVPSLQTAFCKPSCKGVTVQMAGRVFRKHPEVPMKMIVQCEKTKWPFVKTADPVCSYKWELPRDGQPGQWLSLKPNERINEMNCKMIVTLAGINTKLPNYILKKQLEKRGRMKKKRL